MIGKTQDVAEINEKHAPSNAEAMNEEHRKNVSNSGLTGASALTVRQSIWPITLVTILFFLWGFAVSILISVQSELGGLDVDTTLYSTVSLMC